MNRCLIFILVSLAGLSCSKTTMTTAIKLSSDEPKPYDFLAVVAMFPSKTNRAVVETSVAERFYEKDVAASPTYNLLPFAGNAEVMSAMREDPEMLKQKVREKVNQFKIDGLLTIVLLDAQKEERYVSSPSLTISMPTYYQAYPQYDYAFYDYYSYAYYTLHDPGYYKTTTTYFLEANLYDIATEKLLWSGQVTVKDPKSVEKEADTFADLIVGNILQKKVVKPVKSNK